MTEQCIELVEGLIRRRKADGRCVYDTAAKAELVRRCAQPGVSVARLALAHGVNANVLRAWIKRSRTGQGQGLVQSAALLPVRVASSSIPEHAGPDTEPDTEPDTDTNGVIEPVVPQGTIRLRGAVSAAALRTVLGVLTSRP